MCRAQPPGGEIAGVEPPDGIVRVSDFPLRQEYQQEQQQQQQVKQGQQQKCAV